MTIKGLTYAELAMLQEVIEVAIETAQDSGYRSKLRTLEALLLKLKAAEAEWADDGEGP